MSPSYRSMHQHLNINDNEVDNFYQQLHEIIDQTPKKDILVVQGDWNARVGRDAKADWGGAYVDPTAML